MDVEFPHALTDGFNGLLGLVLTGVDQESGEVRATIEIQPHHLQPAGLVHGGVLASMAETVASMGTWLGVHESGATAQGLSNHTSFLRPLLGGTIHCRAIPRHRGRTTWVWEVEITDDEDRLCSLVRMTVAVRPAPDPS